MKHFLALLLCFALTASRAMAAPGVLGGSFIGHQNHALSMINGSSPVTLVFNVANTGWCARIQAKNTKDFKSVLVNFSAVATPGTVTARIETVDATTGKPTGTLYDAAATKQFTPSAGWNTVTFDALPTTGTTAGTEYALVLLKDDAGTTCTLNARSSGVNVGFLPTAVLTAADGTTRSNFAEVAANLPICYFIMEDDSVESHGCLGAAATSTFTLFGSDRVAGQKFVLSNTILVSGIKTGGQSGINRVGTPAGDLRVRILDNSNTAVTGTTVTIDKDSLTNVNARGIYVRFASPITLAAGTYRIALDSSGSADGSNCFSIRYATFNSASLLSSSFAETESTDASTAFTWSDDSARATALGFELDSVSAGSVALDPIVTSQ